MQVAQREYTCVVQTDISTYTASLHCSRLETRRPLVIYGDVKFLLNEGTFFLLQISLFLALGSPRWARALWRGDKSLRPLLLTMGVTACRHSSMLLFQRT